MSERSFAPIAASSFARSSSKSLTFDSSEVIGKKTLVLYFYPADFTGGCTSQACGFRDDIEKILNEYGILRVHPHQLASAK